MNASPCATALISLLMIGRIASAATVGFNQTSVGPWDYNAADNWVDQTIDGIWDSSLTLNATQNVTFGADTVLTTPLTFRYDGSGNQVLRGAGGNWTLTLGGDITVATVSNRTVTIGSTSANQNLNIDLGGTTRTFTVSANRTLTLANSISNGGIIAAGGTINLSGINTYSGSTVVNSGALNLNTSSASIASSDVTLNSANLNVSNSSGIVTRAKSMTLNGFAEFKMTGTSTADSVDIVTNALTVNSGVALGAGAATAMVSVVANANRNAQMVASSFVRNAGSAVLFRGSNLGVNSIASATAGAANISFGTAPSLSGNGAVGSTTVGIIAGAYGDTNATGNGFAATGGLVTYDANNGVRLLDVATEYKPTISDGQSQLDNVRLAGVSGAPVSVALSSATTTVNSLSISVSGSGTDSGVTVSGDAGATLKISSGVIYANQFVTTPTASDIMLINVPTLDLNGKEGIVTTRNVAQSGANGNHNAPLEISSVITNDGGNGLMKAGPGSLKLSGSSQSTYTGNTTLNDGLLYLAKSASDIAIPENTTLVVNGGTLLQTNNQIPDTASVTVNGGVWAVSSSTSNGNVSTETIKNLTITGGTVQNGQTRGGSLKILGSANVSGGLFSAKSDGSNVTVDGAMSISNGGTVTLGASGSTTTFNSKITLNGGLMLSNTADGAYVPISISAGGAADRNGGQLILAGDVTFTGNASNTNTTTISAPTGTGRSGTIALSGSRIWNVGSGAADVDLTVAPALTDFGATIGDLIKNGSGTLELTAANTYTGPTTVNAGTLLVSGSLSGASLVSVNDTGTLGGSGEVGMVNVHLGGKVSPGTSAGTLTAAALTLESGSIYAFEGGDLIDVNGTLDLNEEWVLSLGVGLINGGSVTLFTYDALAGSPDLTPVFDLSLLGFTPSGALSLTDTGSSIVLNGVQAVPEPASFAMLLVGVGALAGRRFRGRKAQSRA